MAGYGFASNPLYEAQSELRVSFRGLRNRNTESRSRHLWIPGSRQVAPRNDGSHLIARKTTKARLRPQLKGGLEPKA